MERSPAEHPRAAFVAVVLACVLCATMVAVAADIPIATVGTGKSPTAVAVDPVTHKVFVANFYGDSVTAIDSVTDTAVATIAMPKGGAIGAVPNAVVVDPLATPPKAYVANWQSHIVSFIDEASLSTVATITVPTSRNGYPRALAIDPTSSPAKLYVANYGKSIVSVLDASTGALIKEIGVGLQPRALGIFVSGSRRRIYVANRGSNDVSVIDGANDTVVATLPTGAGPKSITVDPDTGIAYVSSPTSDTVTVIDATDAVAETIAVGRSPIGMGIESGAGRLFVANRDSNDVSVIDTSSRSVVTTIPAGVNPVAVSVDRGDRKVFVGNYGESSVTIIDSALAVTTCTVGAGPIALATDEALAVHKTYCANWTSSTVTVIDEPTSAVAPLTAVGSRAAAFAVAPDPVSATVDPITGDTTTSPRPVLTGTAVSNRQPFASDVVAVFVSIDGAAPVRAAIVSGDGTPQVAWRLVPEADLAVGQHKVEVTVYDQASAVSASSGQDAVSALSAPAGATAYAFTVAAVPVHLDAITPSAGVPGTVVTFLGSGFGPSQGSGWVSFGGKPGIVVSWSDTTVTAQVPTGVSAGYAGIVRDGVVSNGLWFAPSVRPSLDSVTPGRGGPGTLVTFAGSDFGAAQGAGTVTFSGVSAQVRSWSDTSVVAVVPAGATAGYAGVVQGGLASNGRWFVPFSTPVVSGVSRWWASAEQTVTITGSDFGASQGSGWVTFRGVPLTVESWSDTAIVVRAPASAASGYLGVVQNGATSNGVWFTVVLGPPTVTAVSPTTCPVGGMLTISGSGFGATQGSSWVALAGKSVPVVSWEDTRVVALVPVGSLSGYAGVVRDGVTSNGRWVSVTSSSGVAVTAALFGWAPRESISASAMHRMLPKARRRYSLVVRRARHRRR